MVQIICSQKNCLLAKLTNLSCKFSTTIPQLFSFHLINRYLWKNFVCSVGSRKDTVINMTGIIPIFEALKFYILMVNTLFLNLCSKTSGLSVFCFLLNYIYTNPDHSSRQNANVTSLVRSSVTSHSRGSKIFLNQTSFEL